MNTSKALFLALIGSQIAGADIKPVKHLIDTHIHLYDTTREQKVGWPPEKDKVLYKPHLPTEYSRLAKAAGVTGVVVVEASDRLEDNRWVLDLVKGDPFYIGLVGNVDVYREDFSQHVAHLKRDRRFVGVRARGSKPIDFTHDLVLSNLNMLSQQSLTMDYLTNGGGIPGIKIADKLARTIPNLTIVVDHCLGYDFDGKPPSREWMTAVESLASNKNVYCKISGLYQRCATQPAIKEPSHYRAVLDALWTHFGSRRLIYGSNWPCTKHSGSYASFLKLVDSWISGKGAEAREDYYWRNSATAYRLPLK
ncbi:MAG: amidohydrolase family protein [Roseibacillus sp.]|jgi:predicted TIM-barrel fold metal-dependent hydrolase|nr:amidohydrolase family protein [Roseibacillus sp.]